MQDPKNRTLRKLRRKRRGRNSPPNLDHSFAEPVSLSSTVSADLPLPGTAFGTGFVLLALRARRKQHTNVCTRRVKLSERVMCAICALFFFQRRGSQSCNVTGAPKKRNVRQGQAEASPCVSDQRNSPSRFRFRPPLPLTFPFRVLPPDSVSTYLRSVLGASRTLTCATGGSRCRKKTWPQFAEISFFNISTAFSPTCGKDCGEVFGRKPRGRMSPQHNALAAAATITHTRYSRR